MWGPEIGWLQNSTRPPITLMMNINLMTGPTRVFRHSELQALADVRVVPGPLGGLDLHNFPLKRWYQELFMVLPPTQMFSAQPLQFLLLLLEPSGHS